MHEIADPEIVTSLTDELISHNSGLSPVLINNIGFFMKEVKGKPGKIIIFAIAMFGFNKEGKAFYLENKNGKCVLMEMYQMPIKDKQAGVNFTIKEEYLVARECSYYRRKEEISTAINESRNKIVKKLEKLRE